MHLLSALHSQVFLLPARHSQVFTYFQLYTLKYIYFQLYTLNYTYSQLYTLSYTYSPCCLRQHLHILHNSEFLYETSFEKGRMDMLLGVIDISIYTYIYTYINYNININICIYYLFIVRAHHVEARKPQSLRGLEMSARNTGVERGSVTERCFVM